MAELDPEDVQTIADELRSQLEAAGWQMMSLTDDLAQQKVIDDMVEAGLGAIDQIAYQLGA